ncbi:autotransporter-associated beta strand repeat-containing protein [Oleiharenicola lentus]|uniref:PEP-CTERM sorting domain-containing protein n=1 Tax=Oleiharenicola lentus TaxID=2508720 RepID=UPI003F67ABFD
MNRARNSLLSCVLTLAAVVGLEAQTFIWSGQSTVNGSAAAPANWQGGTAPSGTGAEDLVFGDITGTQNVAQIPTSGFHNITFNGNARPEYSFTGSNTTLTLTGNLTANAGNPNGGSSIDFSSTLDILLTGGAHTVDVTGTIVHVHSDVLQQTAPASIVKTGSGTLYLSGDNTYSGGTTINGGTLIAYNNDGTTPLGSGGVTVNNGGTLQLNYANVPSTLTLNSGSRLTGQGYINDATIGSGVTIAPGFGESGSNAIASLTFEDLTFGPGGKFEMQVRYDSEGGFYSDKVEVYNSATFTISATAANPFTLKLISLNFNEAPGELDGSYLLGHTYFIDFAYTNGVAGSFVLGQNLLLDLTEFDTGGVEMAFSVLQQGNNFKLEFTPVPEPSTYALMALGLGLIGVTVWRRRRAS